MRRAPDRSPRALSARGCCIAGCFTRCFVSLFAGLLVAAALITRASAAAEAPALELLKQAREQFAMAEFPRALMLLKSARSQADPRADAGLVARIEVEVGVVLAVLGRRPAAERAFVSALSHDPTAEIDPAGIKESIVQLFHQTKEQLRGELWLTTDVPSAEIHIDGRRVKQLPLRERVAVGRHEIRARLLGQEIARRQIIVRVEQRTRVALQLKERCGTLEVLSDQQGAPVFVDGQKLGNAPLVLEVPPGEHEVTLGLGERRARRSVSVAAGATVSESFSVAAPPRARPARRKLLWTWISFGSAAISLGFAIGLGAAADSDFDEFRALSLDQREAGEVIESRIRSKATAANVMYGVAGALLAASVVSYFIESGVGRADRRGHRTAQRWRWRITPAAGSFWGMQGDVAY